MDAKSFRRLCATLGSLAGPQLKELRAAQRSPVARIEAIDAIKKRRWTREVDAQPSSAFPGNGQQRAELAEIATLKKEVAKLKAERDMPKTGGGVLRAGIDITFACVAKHRHT